MRENQVIRADAVVFLDLIKQQFTQIIVHQLRQHDHAGTVVFGVALHHAFASHGAAGMSDQQLIPAVQIAPAQGAQFPTAQAGG